MGSMVNRFFSINDHEMLQLVQPQPNSTHDESFQLNNIHREMQHIYQQATSSHLTPHISVMHTLSSPFLKRIAINQQQNLNLTQWQQLFHHYALLLPLLEFLSFQEWQIFKNCSKPIRNNITMRLLKNDNNWNLTMNFLAPYIIKQTRLKQSNIDEQYQHSQDIDRTSGYFQNYNSVEITAQQTNLDKIITTISFQIKYFQGIMPICASLLQCFNQQISYWLLKYLLYKSRYIQVDIHLYQQFIAQLDYEFQHLLPEVYYHLQTNGFQLNYFVMKWIMGLFSEDMSKPMVLTFWDLLCHTEISIIIYLIIAIFKYFGEQILLSTSDEINEMIKSNLKQKLSSIKFQELIKLTKEMYIERRLLPHNNTQSHLSPS